MAELRRSSFQTRNGGAETIKRESWQSCSIWKLPPPPHSHEEIFWEDILRNILITYNVCLWHTRWINAKKIIKNTQTIKIANFTCNLGSQPQKSLKITQGSRNRCLQKFGNPYSCNAKKRSFLGAFLRKIFSWPNGQFSPEACWHFLKAMILRDKLRYLGIL